MLDESIDLGLRLEPDNMSGWSPPLELARPHLRDNESSVRLDAMVPRAHAPKVVGTRFAVVLPLDCVIEFGGICSHTTAGPYASAIAATNKLSKIRRWSVPGSANIEHCSR